MNVTAKKNYIFLITIGGYLSIGLRSKLQKKPLAIKKEHQHCKTCDFFTFNIFVGHFYPPGSGPADQNQCGSGSATLYGRLPISAGTGGKTRRGWRLGLSVC